MYPNGSACYGGNIEHTGLSMAREWETGTMEQLIATPVSAPELIIGKLAPYFCIGVLDLILCICVGQFVFNVPLRGSLWLLTPLAMLFLFGALSFDMLLSIITKMSLSCGGFTSRMLA
jgi:ABC-2 type transport system permease protein